MSMLEDILRIKELITHFDYNDINLTKEQIKVIEQIKDIVCQDKYNFKIKETKENR